MFYLTNQNKNSQIKPNHKTIHLFNKNGKCVDKWPCLVAHSIKDWCTAPLWEWTIFRELHRTGGHEIENEAGIREQIIMARAFR